MKNNNKEKEENVEINQEKEENNEDKKEKDKTEQKKTIKEQFEEKFGDLFKPKQTKINLQLPKNYDEDRTIEQIIIVKGFKVERHHVPTPDGFILNLFRIPGNKTCSDPSHLPPVLFQHGVLDSSDGWVCNGEKHSLPFVLAEKGFDIWLSNSRGNKYCKEHKKYEVESFEFWQFSFDELGCIDVPSVIDYIKKINLSGEKIIYFGHSQGTSLIFAGLASKFDYYKENIKLVVALAPVARLSHVSSKILNFFSAISVDKMISKTKTYEIGGSTEEGKALYEYVHKYAKGLPNFMLGLLSDVGSKEINNQSSIDVYMKHYPCGSSLKCFKHFVQIIKSGKFTKYDYNKEANFVLYGNAEPPEYDLSVIKDLPIILIGGEEDRLANPEDVKWLKEVLGTNVIYYRIVPKMGHISFLCGNDFSWFIEPLEIIMKDFGPVHK